MIRKEIIKAMAEASANYHGESFRDGNDPKMMRGYLVEATYVYDQLVGLGVFDDR